MTRAQSSTHSDVLIVGAGAAGLAAAAALAGAGAGVTLLERKPYVGGRAYSYLHPALNEVVDSQHVVVGCCTNLIDLSERAGVSDVIRWYDSQTFLEPGGRASRVSISALPAPFHFTPSLATASMLSFKDKFGMARGLMEFLRGYPSEDRESAAQWLQRTRQTPQAIKHFWRPVLSAVLNDIPENCSMRYAGQAFHELFIKSSSGGRLGIPTIPLSDFYGSIAHHAEQIGATLKLRASVHSLQQVDGVWTAKTSQGEEYTADVVLLAIPFEQVQRLLPSIDLGTDDVQKKILEEKTSHFLHSPFTSILLWYDREISELDHAWLLDTTIEWFFHKSRIRRYAPERGSYIELVIAASRAQLHQSREEILGSAITEFEKFFPEARSAKLVKSGILKEARATFSVTPCLEAFRPAQANGANNLFLAGDWTATGWPSTMEGSVRSGRLAAEAIARSLGNPRRFLSPDLPPTGFMSLLSR